MFINPITNMSGHLVAVQVTEVLYWKKDKKFKWVILFSAGKVISLFSNESIYLLYIYIQYKIDNT